MRRPLAVLTALALLGVLSMAPAATAAPRPDLVVSKNSKLSLSKGRLRGKLQVRNTGGARAGRFSVTVSVRASGRTRTVKRVRFRGLKPRSSRAIRVRMAVPRGLPGGTLPLRLCADSRHAVRERSERNNCRRLGRLKVARRLAVGSHPADPVPFTKDNVFTLGSAPSIYWITVPRAYDAGNSTPTSLFVWSHGCGGRSEGDIDTISPGGGSQSYIAIAVGGREGQCWDPDVDQSKLLAAIADVKTHFNIDPRRIVLGGYSSGGDLSYRTAFYNSRMFAGVLAENTSPFRDTGSTQAASLAAADFKFHVVHLAHTDDDTYPIAGVRRETDALETAGFPIVRVERPGHHYDKSTETSGTDHDLLTLLLPHLNDGWLSP